MSIFDPPPLQLKRLKFTPLAIHLFPYISSSTKGSKELINHIKARCAGVVYHNALSPVVAQQVLTALRIIMGEDGTTIGATKLKALRDNSNFVRR